MTRAAPARVVVDHIEGSVRVTDLTTTAYLRPRVVETRGNRARVALVAAQAMLLAGDDLRIEVDVGPGACLELVEPSGTVAYHARGGRARWSASVRVAEGGCLVWAGAPFVAAGGADVHRHTAIELAKGAVMLLRETLVLGRSEEDGGQLRATLAATHDGRPLLVEDLDLRDPRLRGSPAVLGAGRVFATAALLGIRPDAPAEPHQTLLAGPGALHREIASQAHAADAALEPTWTRWGKLIG